jgi:hypothetical protein
MKPEVRVQLLKEYERIKKQLDSKLTIPIFTAIVFLFNGVIWFSFHENFPDNFQWIKYVLISALSAALIFELYQFIKLHIDKKIYPILQAILDKSEEPIQQKEKVEIDGTD